jgi:hypothetical protein
MLEKIKGEKFYFSSWFHSFQSVVGLLHSFCACGEGAQLGKRAYQSKAAYLMAARSKESKEEAGDKINPSRAFPPVTYFLQLGPTS